MSAKLDQSLDEILSTTRRSTVRGANKSRRGGKPRAAAPPVGGVRKASQQQKPAKATPTAPSAAGKLGGESKIQISGLPKDVDERQLKEYFAKSIQKTKRVEIAYGPNGVSRGVATVTFADSQAATQAVSKVNGVLVDGKALKIEVVVDASRAASIPGPKPLGERIQQKAQPKSAAKEKPSATAARGKGARGRGGKAGRARPVKKTAEELDSEMADYFTANSGDASGAAQPNGDAPMDDEIMVSSKSVSGAV
ncbi:putative mRNA export protein mlo3 [Bisporella sp. PMI_857]|nr:putative mRNA export protein mlo3 [Bisporella sp. PMI_857]